MTGETPKVSDRLCEYAVSLGFDDLPAEVVERTKQLFLDFLACTLGGHRIADSSAPITRGVANLVRGAQGACTVIGRIQPVVATRSV